jgi:hypothetical protein
LCRPDRLGALSSREWPHRPRLAPLIYLRQRKGVRGVEAEAIVSLRSARNYTEVRLADGSMVPDLRPLGLWPVLPPPRPS